MTETKLWKKTLTYISHWFSGKLKCYCNMKRDFFVPVKKLENLLLMMRKHFCRHDVDKRRTGQGDTCSFVTVFSLRFCVFHFA